MEVTKAMGQGDLAPQLDLQASVMRLDNGFQSLFTQLCEGKHETRRFSASAFFRAQLSCIREEDASLQITAAFCHPEYK
jgi:hypothetical protein